MGTVGLVEVRPQRGTFISKISQAAVMDARGRWRREALPSLPLDGGADVSALAVTDDGAVTAAVEQRTPTL